MEDPELIRTLFNQKCDLSETLARMKYGEELIEHARAHFMDCLSLDQQECIARDPHPYERMIVEIYGNRSKLRIN